MEYLLGNIPRAEEYIGIILDRDDFKPMETLLLKKMKAQILATAHLRWSEACDYGLDAVGDSKSHKKGQEAICCRCREYEFHTKQEANGSNRHIEAYEAPYIQCE